MNIRTKKVNDNFFEIIDTEEKAYILGFLYADGYIVKVGNSYKIKISLSKKDKVFLEKISRELCDYPVKDYITKTKIARSGTIENSEVTFRSEKMFNDLYKKGLTNRKSLILKFPTNDQVPEFLLCHFIRGYFDGDGSVSVYTYFSALRNKRYERIEINFCGTFEFLDELRILLNLPNSCLKKEKRRITNCYKLQFTGVSRVNNLYNLMYKNCHLQLNRKRKVFENFLQERCSTTIIDNPEMD